MTSRDFCYWIQGYFEIAEASKDPGEVALDATQVEVVKRHLALVFVHEIDPSAGPPDHQKVLDDIHHPASGGTSGKPSVGYPSGHGEPVFRC